MTAPVALAPCPDYSEENCRAAIRAVVEHAPALQAVKPGARVLIKANLVTRMSPDKAATTHPALIAALVEFLREKGAEAVVGDSPGGPFARAYLDAVYAGTGMKNTGAAVNGDFSVKHASFPEAAVLKDFDYTGWLDGGDLIVNFCKLKSHGMMGLSCAVKNMFGAIPGITKPAYHYRFPDYGAFADMLIDLNEYFKPAFHIVDAVTAMEGNGPTAGTPRHMGAVLGSESPYALDLVCAGLIGRTAKEIPTLVAAYRRGLAPETAEEAPLAGDASSLRVSDFDIPGADAGMERFLHGGGAFSNAANGALKAILAARPRLEKPLCVSCGKCASLCPAEAITMLQKLPRIDKTKCIRCFCCQEFCPAGALRPRRSGLGDFVLRHTQR